MGMTGESAGRLCSPVHRADLGIAATCRRVFVRLFPPLFDEHPKYPARNGNPVPGFFPTKETAMMDQAMDQFDRARGRMAGDFKNMITDSEDLLKAAATVSSEGFTVARIKFEEKLKQAKVALADASRPAFDMTRKTAAAADGYVRGNPWAAVGTAMAAGALIGFLAAKR